MARLTGICFCAPARTERCAGDAQLARHGLTNHYSTLTVNAKKCPKLWVDPFIAFVRVGVFMIARAFSWGGEVGGDAAFGLGEDGEDQQAAVGERLFPIRGNAFRQAPGGTDDDGWLAAQENAKALLFDRGVEAADDAVAGIAPLGGLVVGAEDEFARTTGGAEQGRRGLRQKVEVTERSQLGRGVGAQTLAQADRVTGIVTRDCLGLRHGGIMRDEL